MKDKKLHQAGMGGRLQRSGLVNMEAYPIVLYSPHGESYLYELLAQRFDPLLAHTLDDILDILESSKVRLILLDFSNLGEDFEVCRSLKDHPDRNHIPIIAVVSQNDIDLKLEAFESGCEDLLLEDMPSVELEARLNKAIYSGIAHQQLQYQLTQATKVANTAMNDKTQLESSLRFLININNCETLDQLGMLYFAAIQNFNLSCCLQLRSIQGEKNLEASGIERELESNLLRELKSEGQFYDFGKRTVINCGNVSVLIRNMPQDNPLAALTIKNSVFGLLQGLNARLIAMDEHYSLMRERDALKKLSRDVQEVMTEIDRSFHEVNCDIANEVEKMAEAISDKIPNLLLSEEEENFFQSVADNCVSNTMEVFNRGLKVDEIFQRLAMNVELALHEIDMGCNGGEQLATEVETLPSARNKSG